MMRIAATIGMLVPLSLPVGAFANDAVKEAEEMIARANEMRAEADALAKKATEMMEAAKAEEAAAAEKEAEEETEVAEAGDGAPGDNITSAYEEGGVFFTADDIPTFNVAADGTVDWSTFSGFRRYHSECHVCHGPDGEGSSYAPALKKSALDMDYYDFVDVVVNGRKRVGAAANSVMPSFGDNKNVMCYLDDMYIYLKARGTDDVPRGRPAKKAKKSAEYKEAESACMDG
jgi:methanol metabolism-related c-type cytochrome